MWGLAAHTLASPGCRGGDWTNCIPPLPPLAPHRNVSFGSIALRVFPYLATPPSAVWVCTRRWGGRLRYRVPPALSGSCANGPAALEAGRARRGVLSPPASLLPSSPLVPLGSWRETLRAAVSLPPPPIGFSSSLFPPPSPSLSPLLGHMLAFWGGAGVSLLWSSRGPPCTPLGSCLPLRGRPGPLSRLLSSPSCVACCAWALVPCQCSAALGSCCPVFHPPCLSFASCLRAAAQLASPSCLRDRPGAALVQRGVCMARGARARVPQRITEHARTRKRTLRARFSPSVPSVVFAVFVCVCVRVAPAALLACLGCLLPPLPRFAV